MIFLKINTILIPIQRHIKYYSFIYYNIITGVVIILEEKSTLEKINVTCWEYFNCSESSKKICPAFKKGIDDGNFRECWLFIKDNLKGGPEEKGPCASCEWLLKYTSNFSIQ